MQRDVFHPATGQISLPAVYNALSDPVRLQIVARLSELGELGELTCSAFLDYGSKTVISYHLARMREAGVTRTRIEGKQHYVSLRAGDLETRFPGLLPVVIASVRAEVKAAARKSPVCAAPKRPAKKPAARKSAKAVA
ncbi:MAG TPA: helix-turn-helix domain-containing protein [Burkholderiales bacterium]